MPDIAAKIIGIIVYPMKRNARPLNTNKMNNSIRIMLFPSR